MKECPACRQCFEHERRICPNEGAPLQAVFEGTPVLDGKYRLIRQLGSGGGGGVYKARHLGLSRLVAVKILHPRFALRPRFVARFRREAEALGRLRHPQIVEVTDFGVDSGRGFPYLVMEFLEGETLAERLNAGGPLAPELAIRIFDQIAAGVDHAHAAGILHRDLKPSNVFLIDRHARTPEVKVLDFGLARFMASPEETPPISASRHPSSEETDADLTDPESVIGTPGYRAPETLMRKPPTRAVDIYALGMVMKRCLQARTTTAKRGAAQDPFEPAFATVLARDPEARPASARSAVDLLRRGIRRHQRRRRRRREAPGLAAWTAFLSLWIAILAGVLEAPLQPFEERLIDARFLGSAKRSPTYPLVLLMIDDAYLATDPTPLVDQGEKLGRFLSRLLESGAAGVGIDLLLGESWGRSAAFSDLLVRHGDRLALAAFSPPEGAVLGTEAVSDLTLAALGHRRVLEMFGFVHVDVDPGGKVRRARRFYRDVEGRTWDSFVSRSAAILRRGVREDPWPASEPPNSFRIDFTLDWRQLEQLSWRDLPARLAADPESFRGSFVLVGANFTGSGGRFAVPRPRGLPGEVDGPVLRALTLHTLLDGAPLRELGRVWAGVAAGLAGSTIVAVLLFGARRWVTLTVALVVMAGWAVAAQTFFSAHRWIVPVAPVISSMVVVMAVAAAVRRYLQSHQDHRYEQHANQEQGQTCRRQNARMEAFSASPS